MNPKTRKTLVFLVAAFLVLFAADALFAQCAMCRTTLEQNEEMAAGFNNGILFLLGMPYLVFGSIGLTWYLKRRKMELAEQRALGSAKASALSESSI